MMLEIFLIIGAFCLGVVLGDRDARKKRGNWRHYGPSTDILKDYKNGY